MSNGNRIAPDWITELKNNEVFVFGSNLGGHHGMGAARTAIKWGAKYGKCCGLYGKTYGIPTVNASITNKLSIDSIKPHVDRFIQFASEHQELKFLVTEIGCGLAGHIVKDIAPLFANAASISNIYLPKSFWRVLSHGY